MSILESLLVGLCGDLEVKRMTRFRLRDNITACSTSGGRCGGVDSEGVLEGVRRLDRGFSIGGMSIWGRTIGTE